MDRTLIPNVEVLRAHAMPLDDYWDLFDGINDCDLRALDIGLRKLSYKKLFAYELRQRFLLLDKLDLLDKPSPKTVEPEMFAVVLRVMLLGRKQWDHTDLSNMNGIEPLNQMQIDEFASMVGEIWLERFVGRTIRDNPARIANSLFDIAEFAQVKPFWKK